MIEPLIREVEQLKRQFDGLKTQDRLSWSAMSGATNPAQPAYGNNRPFFRIDLGWWIFYDGTRWLTCQEFACDLGTVGNNTVGLLAFTRIRRDYTAFVTRVAITTQVNNTNNASHYYTVEVQSLNTDQTAATTLASFDTRADTVYVLTPHDSAINATVGVNNFFLGVATTGKTGTPGYIYPTTTIYYRLIVT